MVERKHAQYVKENLSQRKHTVVIIYSFEPLDSGLYGRFGSLLSKIKLRHLELTFYSSLVNIVNRKVNESGMS